MITTELLSDADPVAQPTLETAARLKIPFYKPGYYRYKFVDPRKEREDAGRQLRGLADLSRRHGMRLGYHNHAGYIGGPVWDFASFIEPLDAATVGYYFDVRHAVVEGGDGGWRTAFDLVAPRLSMIALKDFFWEKSGGSWQQRNCPMGEGMVDWKRFFAMLAKARFHGPVSLHVEYEVTGDHTRSGAGEHVGRGRTRFGVRQGTHRRSLFRGPDVIDEVMRARPYPSALRSSRRNPPISASTKSFTTTKTTCTARRTSSAAGLSTAPLC